MTCDHEKADEWMPIETAPKGVKVLAGYWNECGMWRTITARYYLAGTLDSSEWNESEDGYAAEGWYEESEAQDMLLPTDRPPTHWQPLPSPPTSAAP
jgi:hypothetical protein